MTYSAMAAPRAQYRAAAVPAISIPKLRRMTLQLTLACLLGLIYLVQVTHTDAYGYKLNDYRTQAAQLQQEHDDLVLASARMQNLDRAQAYAVENTMVQTSPQ